MEQNDNVVKVDLSKPLSTNETIHKIDLTKPVNNENQGDEVESNTVESSDESTAAVQEQEEVQQESEVQEDGPVLEVIGDEEIEEVAQELNQEETVVKTEETTVEEQVEQLDVKVSIPEDVQKLISFMEETGGDLQDYVRLNTDVSKLDTTDVLDEYYKQTKPHLSSEERSFLLEETFSYDEEVDTDKDIKRKKIALKEEAAKARKYLESQKDKYYNEIKAGSNLSVEQKEAIDFYNKHKKDSIEANKVSESNKKDFLRKTDNLFNSEFKGFDFNIGDKKFRYNVKNINEVKTSQSDLNNFVSKFVDGNNQLQDAAGYHKSLYAAMNVDALAQHFYEQGKADAIKQTVAKSKNINTEARQIHGETQVGGTKYKVLGSSSSDFKIKMKRNR